MSHAPVKKSAFEQITLLDKVVRFKQQFYPSAWARYDLAKPGSMRLIPPEHVVAVLREDYRWMRNMIFGKYWDFDDILEDIKVLDKEINLLTVK